MRWRAWTSLGVLLIRLCLTFLPVPYRSARRYAMGNNWVVMFADDSPVIELFHSPEALTNFERVFCLSFTPFVGLFASLSRSFIHLLRAHMLTSKRQPH